MTNSIPKIADNSVNLYRGSNLQNFYRFIRFLEGPSTVAVLLFFNFPLAAAAGFGTLYLFGFNVN